MNLMPAGPVERVLVGGGPGTAEVQEFLRSSHHDDNVDGTSYVALGIVDNFVWLLTGRDHAELTAALETACATDAEIIELRNLH